MLYKGVSFQQTQDTVQTSVTLYTCSLYHTSLFLPSILSKNRNYFSACYVVICSTRILYSVPASVWHYHTVAPHHHSQQLQQLAQTVAELVHPVFLVPGYHKCHPEAVSPQVSQHFHTDLWVLPPVLVLAQAQAQAGKCQNLIGVPKQ